MAEEVGEGESPGQTERHGQQHGQGQDVALVLGTENQIDEHQAKHKDQRRGVARLSLGAAQSRVFISIAVGQVVLGHLLDGLHHLTGGIAGAGINTDVDGREKVETANI